MFRDAGDVDTGAALLTLDDGTLATVTATRMHGAGYDVRMELAVSGPDRGRPGRPYADRVHGTDRTAGRGQAVDGVFLERFGAAYEAELIAFVEVVRGERANPCDGREALRALLIAEACEKSRRERRPVRPSELLSGSQEAALTLTRRRRLGGPGPAGPSPGRPRTGSPCRPRRGSG
ncbi:Gfo/Idh/MocA family oxidoreductase [Microbacterium terregens]|uniref:Gfo/Idh/MocA family oxidoreductase n=1 Tax=Microbacterium terregens TaxID=69363 RepID=UPI0031D758DA